MLGASDAPSEPKAANQKKQRAPLNIGDISEAQLYQTGQSGNGLL